MKNWRVELTSKGKSLSEAKIRIDIFQGDALSLFLFVIAFMLLNHIENALVAENLLNSKKRSITWTTSSSLPKMKKN